MVQRLKGIFASGLFVIAAVFFVLTAVGRLSGNIGWLVFRDQLTVVRSDLSNYPSYQSIDQTAAQSSQIWLERAVALNSADRAARWNLGRIALAAGETGAAAEWLEPLVADARFNMLLQMDRLSALSLTGRRDEVLTGLQEQSIPEPLRPPWVRATVEGQVAELIRTGRPEDLTRAWQIRPTDLYANYRLWQQAQRISDTTKAELYRQAVMQFTREAIEPVDEQLFESTTSIMPDLRAAGLWDREQTWRVAAFLVWQHATAPSVEDLLKALAARYPDEAEWSELLREQQARQVEQLLAQGNPGISETELTDEQFVAEQLGVRIEQIDLGPNLVENGSFKRWTNSTPDDWHMQTYLGKQASDGLYVFGGDSLFADWPVARIDSLRGADLSDGSRAYAEYVGDSFAIAEGPYLVSISFRTYYSESGGIIFFSDYPTINGFTLAYQNLPETHGQRQQIQLVVRAPIHSQSITPVLRNWGLGTMWIDSISVRQVTCSATACR